MVLTIKPGKDKQACKPTNPAAENPRETSMGEPAKSQGILPVNNKERPGVTDRIPVKPGDITLEHGYKLEPVVSGLTYPTSVTFDEQGNIYVGESGFSYGPAKSEEMGRILKVDKENRLTEIAGEFRGPLTGLTWHQGHFYVAEGAYPGAILKVSMNGTKQVLVTGLQSGGDHYTSDVAFGPDGKLYFGVGTFTNSGVVGLDNFLNGWLPNMPQKHDIPSRDIILTGHNFLAPDPFALTKNQVVTVATGAYKPFGIPSTPGELIKGQFFSNAVIYRCNPDGTGLELYADGIRNPFGLGFTPTGKLIATDQGYDARGSRQVANATDPLWEIVKGGWYGYPDYVSGKPITNPIFQVPGQPPLQFLLAQHLPLAGQPIVEFPVHSASTKFSFSTNSRFGFTGEAFVAQLGAGSPATGPSTGMPGFRVVRTNLETRQFFDFLRIHNPGPRGTGPARPVDAKFNPCGESLYIVDFGIIEANESGFIPWARSGGLWKISRV